MTFTPDDDRIQKRAQLLPEEQAAGSDDPEAQARAILEESERRITSAEEARREASQVTE